MNAPHHLATVALLCIVAAAQPAAAKTPPAAAQALSTHDGLEPVRVKDLDLAYARPGATLAAYRKVMLDAVEVSFHKSWEPKRPGTAFKLSTEERENIRQGVAKVVRQAFVNELQAQKRYPVVERSGADVLRVKASIIDLYVNAPDVPGAVRSRSYTVSAGEMTLVAELYDSESGQILARVVDRREARDTGMLTLSSSVINAGEADEIASRWARILRKALDQAQPIGTN